MLIVRRILNLVPYHIKRRFFEKYGTKVTDEWYLDSNGDDCINIDGWVWGSYFCSSEEDDVS